MREIRPGAHRDTQYGCEETAVCDVMDVEEALVTERVRKPERRVSVHWLVRGFGKEGGPGPFINPSSD
jgi:hypothetical protein